MLLEYDIFKICQPTKLEDEEEERKVLGASNFFFFEKKYSLFQELVEEEGEFYLEFRVDELFHFKDLLELSFQCSFIVEFEML